MVGDSMDAESGRVQLVEFEPEDGQRSRTETKLVEHYHLSVTI